MNAPWANDDYSSRWRADLRIIRFEVISSLSSPTGMEPSPAAGRQRQLQPSLPQQIGLTTVTGTHAATNWVHGEERGEPAGVTDAIFSSLKPIVLNDYIGNLIRPS